VNPLKTKACERMPNAAVTCFLAAWKQRQRGDRARMRDLSLAGRSMLRYFALKHGPEWRGFRQ
jgi:hypothetical protein